MRSGHDWDYAIDHDDYLQLSMQIGEMDHDEIPEWRTGAVEPAAVLAHERDEETGGEDPEGDASGKSSPPIIASSYVRSADIRRFPSVRGAASLHGS